jgi:hypothetical protein
MIPRLSILGALLLLLTAPALFADEPYNLFNTYIDLTGNGVATPGSDFSLPAGAGGQLFLDLRLDQKLAIGTGITLGGYNNFYTSSWDLETRLFPFGSQADGDFYVQLAAGLSLKPAVLPNDTQSYVHGLFSLGYSIKGIAPRIALDLGPFYEVYTPWGQILQAVGVKAGLVLSIGDLEQ